MDQNSFLSDPPLAGFGEQKVGSQPRKVLVAICMIMVAGLVLRLIAISGRGIWYDDAFSIFLARRSLPEIIVGTAADTMPPLYYFLLHFWMMAGESIVWLRFLNVILSLTVIWLVYVLAWKMFGPRIGLWAALLTAVSPMQIYHAQEIRMYALLELTQLGYILFFFSIITYQENRSKTGWFLLGNWIGMVVCGAGAMYTHNLAIFVLVVPNLILLVGRRWRLFTKLLAAQAAIIVLAIPWLIMVPGQIDKIQRAFWTPQPGLVEVLQAIVVFTAALPLPGVWQALAILLSVEAFVLTVLVVGRRLFRRYPPNGQGNGTTGRNWRLEAIVMLALVPPILMFAASYLMRPVFVPRGFLLSSLAYYILIAWMVGGVENKAAGRLVIGAVLAAAFISLPFQSTYDLFPRSPFGEAASWLNANMEPGSRVIHDNKLSYFPTHFYSPDLEQVFLGDERGSHNDTFAPASQAAMGVFPEDDMRTASHDVEQVYFVVFEKTIQEYQAAGLPGHPNLEWLDSCYGLVEQVSFEDLTVYHYGWLGTCQVED
jgi:mannosyltransferase